jgi:3-oxoacyl-[acyl-carrier protein] reductase
MKRLQGKLALITGSARGIGQQTAVALAKEGCDIIVHGRTKENTEATIAMVKELGVKAYAVWGELSNQDEVENIITAVKRIGNVDILYNNAAIMANFKPIWEVTREDWERMMQINFYSVVRLSTVFGYEMKERGYGRIINVTTGMNNEPSLSPYSVSKAAVDKFTKELAFELRGTGVLANLLDPGWLRTNLGGPYADHAVETVVPGAIVPALADDPEFTAQLVRAQDYRGKIV